MLRFKLSLALFTLAVLLTPGPSLSETLREALTAHHLGPGDFPAAELDQKITSYAALDDPQGFLIAYYPDDGSGRLGDTLWLALLRKPERTWMRRQLRRDSDGSVTFGGSVLGIIRVGGFLYLNTHVNPSASFTLVLDADLNYRDSIYGWLVGWFSDGLIVYQNSEVHFAPTHYVEISAYDPGQKKQWLIYPRQPYQPVRLAHIEKVRAEYQRRGDGWFREHNHHGDPELFDTFLRSEVAVNEATRSLAFRIGFDNADTWDYAEKLKSQRFGGLASSLAGYDVSKLPPEGVFVLLGQALEWNRSLNFREAFIELFKSDPEAQAIIRHTLANTGEPPSDWRQHFVSLDPRWSHPEIWQKVKAALATPPETTEVVCIIRHLDQPPNLEYREMLLTDLQKQFGDRALAECLEPETLRRIFAR